MFKIFLKCWMTLKGRLANMIRPSLLATSGNPPLAEIGSQEVCHSWYFISKGWLLGSWERNAGVGKRLGDVSLDRIYSYKFYKVRALRKGRSVACHQEETCQKFSQAEETLRPPWSVVWLDWSHMAKALILMSASSLSASLHHVRGAFFSHILFLV